MNKENLMTALRNAGPAHGDYETNILNGVYDENWPQWYAAFVVGELGLENVRPSRLTSLLKDAYAAHQARGGDSDWVEFYADYILKTPSRKP